MEKYRIVEDSQGKTRMVEIPTENLHPSELEKIFSGQLEMPNSGMVLVLQGKSIPISPKAMEIIKGQPTPERERLKGVVVRAMEEAQLIQIFTCK